MTQMMSPQAGSVPERSEPDPFLSLRTTVLLLTAMFLGSVVGLLSYLTGVGIASALLTGLMSAGVCLPALNSLVGKHR